MKRVVFLFMLCSMVSVEAQTVIASWNFADTNMTGITYNTSFWHPSGYISGQPISWCRQTDSLMGNENDGYMFLEIGRSGEPEWPALSTDATNTCAFTLPKIKVPSEGTAYIQVSFDQRYKKYNDYCYVDWYDSTSGSWRSHQVNVYVPQDSIASEHIDFVLPLQTIQDSIQIRFRNYSSAGSGQYGHYDYRFGYYWAVDNVEIITPPSLNLYQLSVQVQPAGTGTVTGVGTYADGETATLEAVANEGWHFERWSDNNTDNPRTIVVTCLNLKKVDTFGSNTESKNETKEMHTTGVQ